MRQKEKIPYGRLLELLKNYLEQDHAWMTRENFVRNLEIAGFTETEARQLGYDMREE